MKADKSALITILAVISVLALILPLSACGNSFPYEGSLTGNWSGQLTIIGRAIPIGGTMTVKIDSKGAVSGTIASSSGGASGTSINGQVDSNGNLTGTVSFALTGTTFVSNWQGKLTGSGNSLNMKGTWTSQHGSGTFTGTATR
jgi:hypothetical protein